MKPLVLYHAGCWDGFCAAWIARKALGDIEAIPVQYGQDHPIKECGRDVYILDFSYPRQVMKGIIGKSEFVCVLDHHKTAQAELDGLADEISREGGSWEPHIAFDMTKSGGRLAWEYFYRRTEICWPNLLQAFPGCTQQKAPWLVDYTEDRDLWRHKLDWTKEINAWIRSYPLDFELWDKFALVSPGCEAWDMRVDAGSAILRAEKQIIDQHVKHASEIEMDGHKILAVNATVQFSEIAGELAKDRPFGACYFIRADGKRVWSLRSRDDGIDVSAIAKAHGGGGHRNASGFTE